MTSLFSYLITMLVAIFWGFRIVVSITASTGTEFFVQPLNLNVEIILLFVTLVCIILIIKKNVIGAVLYLLSYGLYFGVDLYNKLSSTSLSTADYGEIFVSSAAMLLAILTFLNIILNKSSKGVTKNKKTDWFYGTDKYVREKDERDDNNQYKI